MPGRAERREVRCLRERREVSRARLDLAQLFDRLLLEQRATLREHGSGGVDRRDEPALQLAPAHDLADLADPGLAVAIEQGGCAIDVPRQDTAGRVLGCALQVVLFVV